MNRPGAGPLPPAFEATVQAVERAKDALLAAVPSPRGKQRRTVAEAVLEFEEHLRDAGAQMDRWRRPELEREWRACSGGVGESLRRAERLRLEAPPLDYEGLVGVLGDLIEPLEVFTEAARRAASGP